MLDATFQSPYTVGRVLIKQKNVGQDEKEEANKKFSFALNRISHYQNPGIGKNIQNCSWPQLLFFFFGKATVVVVYYSASPKNEHNWAATVVCLQ
ncbi:hypothetical protein Tsubulata_049490 [Turnera subulata]|uniref:Uncharacterized protein n=1 Tax=Turnera subulata TaxID=218843 RepID=A0A9Q0F3U7_9ROSI|nr:hypothetical protein Tsubulata_049490 [Turnera subulata]